ncbi:hypothetical protein NQ318_020314, partial [Aromia moschata]
KPGANTIKRASTQSSVTIPFERTFRGVDTNLPTTGGEALALFNFCGRGWPYHMLIPKGTVDGMPCELFVMISSYDDDRLPSLLLSVCLSSKFTMDNSNLLLLLDRPQEPLFTIKDDDKRITISAPPEFLNEKYRDFGANVVSRFGDTAKDSITVPDIPVPNMEHIKMLKRDDAFSHFIDSHRELAGDLINILMSVKGGRELWAAACYARENLNPQLFNYAYTVALLHRPDTKELNPPAVVHHFPDKFVGDQAIGQAREEVTVVPQEELRTPIEIPRDYTASDLDEEHRLAYFREDIGVNLHHWHWHEVYPTKGPKAVVDKDRRGELFYYMHQQIIARYNFDRFANGLQRVKRLLDFDEPIKEAYFPKLDRLVSQRPYAGRGANLKMQNVSRAKENSYVDVPELKRWRDTIYNAINSGSIQDKNRQSVPLDEFKGIDILGNLIEASDLSLNPQLYGNLHNQGHNIISVIHDPDNKHLEEPGVMGDVATAMRDPVFYRWHSFINNIFQDFKATLPRYTVEQLNFPGIEVKDIEVKNKAGGTNQLDTFWQQSDVNVSGGLDYQRRGKVFVRFTHLQHADFTYTITVDNKSGAMKEGTCRIFLAPKHDERGNPWQYRDQKNMFIEMDKFKVDLKQGPNTITRESTKSSVTIPFDRSYRDLSVRPKDDVGKAQFNFCGCGWPHNMLVPKGTPQGMPCELFVMISNYEDDKVDQSIDGQCNDAYSYCGIRDKLYPDRKSMGYPFDRQPRDGVRSLQDFLTPNMRVKDVTIKFENRTIVKKQTN